MVEIEQEVKCKFCGYVNISENIHRWTIENYPDSKYYVCPSCKRIKSFINESK